MNWKEIIWMVWDQRLSLSGSLVSNCTETSGVFALKCFGPISFTLYLKICSLKHLYILTPVFCHLELSISENRWNRMKIPFVSSTLWIKKNNLFLILSLFIEIKLPIIKIFLYMLLTYYFNSNFCFLKLPFGHTWYMVFLYFIRF